jgi:outer membrane protein
MRSLNAIASQVFFAPALVAAFALSASAQEVPPARDSGPGPSRALAQVQNAPDATAAPEPVQVAPVLQTAPTTEAASGATLGARAEGPAGTPAFRRSSLEECVTIALQRNIDVESAREDVSASESSLAGVRGEFGPKVHVDASALRYDSAYVVMGFPVHDIFTWNVTAMVTQPLTPLLAIYDAYKVRELGVDIAGIEREAIRRDTASRVVESYYRLLEAERLAEVAVASVDQLQAQLRQANSFHTNGIVSRDDVLRAELAVANAQQRLIQSRARVTLERSMLAVLMGMPPDSPIDAQPLPSDTPPPRDLLTLERAEQLGEAQRVELREVDRRIQQSERDVHLAWLKLAPEINAVAAYVHNEGSPFNPPNSGYVGATASWDVWDWGTTTSGISAAQSRRRQAALARSKLDDQIRLEVRQAFVGVGAASEAIAVAQASVAAAEENFRLVKKRYEANSATSFDVTDAEALLTQARGQSQTALYEYLIARGALRRAMGEPPETLARP